ncbi:MAG: CoA-binding protein [Calditrichaeota bacterium]|nr:CoA-binding protein [Calditrichota bacterium]
MSPKPLNDQSVIKEILATKGKIVIVGLSPKPERDSNRVAQYMIGHGYEIVPVNPMSQEILGRKCYPSIADVPGEIAVVDVFRKSDDVPPIVEQAIAKGAKFLWLQLGVVHQEAAQTALNAGMGVVMNKCIKIEHSLKNGS